MYRAALALKVKELGAAHPDVGITLNNLGILLANEGRIAEAEVCCERGWRLLRKSLGRNHPNSRAVRKNLERLRRGL